MQYITVEIKTYFIIGRKKGDGVVENVGESTEAATPKPDTTTVNLDGEAGAHLSTESDTLMNDASTNQVPCTHGNHTEVLPLDVTALNVSFV